MNEFKANLDYSEKMSDRLQHELQLIKDQLEASHQRERQLQTKVETETKVDYQGTSYHITTLIEHLQTKDNQMRSLQERQE